MTAIERKFLTDVRAFFEDYPGILFEDEEQGIITMPLYKVTLELAMDTVASSASLTPAQRTGYRVANERLQRAINKAGGLKRTELIHNSRHTVWWNAREDIDYAGGYISWETFCNWQILINIAYLDRILDTGEIK